MAVILGTAGHIDHGKTTLIRALTTIDCDRLAEEKKRGITIELGFAWLDLPDGERLGIIDVPGHERFVRNMVAGACGMDLVLLVIACDEGIMPQTREHVEICQLLGIKRGLVALTKSDTVEPDWLAMVKDEVTSYLATTFLAGAPILPVSAETGAGLTELKAALGKCAQACRTEKTADLFRLPIDRVFTIRGHGTVVTGTVLGGTLSVGETVAIMPCGLESRARSIERHEETVTTIESGSRCAINLQNVETSALRRGDTIARPGTLIPKTRWYVRIDALKSAPMPLKQRSELHLHHGTRECLVRLVFRDRTVLEPGESAFAEVLFPEPFCAVFGDRAVLRSGNPLRTVAGAYVLSPIPPLSPKHEKDKEARIARYLGLPEQKKNDTLAFVDTILSEMAGAGLDFASLRVATGLAHKELEKILKLLCDKGLAILWHDDEERFWIASQRFARLTEACLARASQIHEKDPLKETFARDALISDWSRDLPKKLISSVIDRAIRSHDLVSEKDGLRLKSHTVRLAQNEAALKEAIIARHKAQPFSPPNYKDVLLELGVTEKEAAPVLAHLVRVGDLVKIKDGLFYERAAYQTIMEKVTDYFADHDHLGISELKGILGISRKYLIALLEYMDNSHITVRVGDTRTLRKNV
ncbi:MAG: selenocysteine-specific translation elongation factor [Desulfovibrionaceae bacterium]|nr:selenocysteine-specific translation elongation factor [Desulfovibrionaceae bacterium]